MYYTAWRNTYNICKSFKNLINTKLRNVLIASASLLQSTRQCMNTDNYEQVSRIGCMSIRTIICIFACTIYLTPFSCFWANFEEEGSLTGVCNIVYPNYECFLGVRFTKSADADLTFQYPPMLIFNIVIYDFDL